MNRESSNLARTPLVNELSTSKSRNRELKLRLYIHKTRIMFGSDGSLLFMPSWLSTVPYIFKVPDNGGMRERY